jgi:hypothetical protein
MACREKTTFLKQEVNNQIINKFQIKSESHMGKERNGRFIPPKGKPSGSGKDTVGLKNAFAVNDPETDHEIANKYAENIEDLAPNMVRHKNRNVNKGEENDED